MSGRQPAERDEGSASPGGRSREAITALMLRACGERGYRGVRLEELGAGDGWFRDEADCFASGYASEGERLRRLFAHARDGGAGAREVLEVVLGELSGLIAERPAVARSLFAEVHVAGGAAARERTRLLADLARVVDGLYRKERALRPALPDAAPFMVEVIETVALRASIAEDPAILTTAIPDLVLMLEDVYGDA